MAKKKETYRNYTAPTDDKPIATCGKGSDVQKDVHVSPGKLFLFNTPDPGNPGYFPELTALSERLNSIFSEEGIPCERRKRVEERDRNIDITIAILEDGFYLTYAAPAAGKISRGKKYLKLVE